MLGRAVAIHPWRAHSDLLREAGEKLMAEEFANQDPGGSALKKRKPRAAAASKPHGPASHGGGHGLPIQLPFYMSRSSAETSDGWQFSI